MYEETPTGEGFDTLVAQLAAKLELDAAAIEALRECVVRAADTYEVEGLIKAISGSPKYQKQKITQLQHALAETIERLGEISPECQVAIGSLVASRGNPAGLELIEFQDRLLEVYQAAGDFLKRYEPKRGSRGNPGLELAVRELLPVIEAITGQEALISWNKNNDRDPAPRSKAAEAILGILREIDPRLRATTVFDMIVKVRSRPKPPEHHFDAVIRAHAYDADLALVGRRHK